MSWFDALDEVESSDGLRGVVGVAAAVARNLDNHDQRSPFESPGPTTPTAWRCPVERSTLNRETRRVVSWLFAKMTFGVSPQLIGERSLPSPGID
jgi:hypothetical protein